MCIQAKPKKEVIVISNGQTTKSEKIYETPEQGERESDNRIVVPDLDEGKQVNF